MLGCVLSERLLERCALDEVISDGEKTEEKVRENRNSQVPHFPTAPMLVSGLVWPGAVPRSFHEGREKSE